MTGGAIATGWAAVTGAQPWLQYHADSAHTGAIAVPTLVPSTAAWTSTPLDGDVYGEPLFGDGLLLAGTGGDSVYGLDPGSGAVRWRTHLAGTTTAGWSPRPRPAAGRS